jgi:hypothetical protein
VTKEGSNTLLNLQWAFVHQGDIFQAHKISKFTFSTKAQGQTLVSQNLPSIRFWTALTAATLAAVAALFAAWTALFTSSSTRRKWMAFSAVLLADCKLKQSTSKSVWEDWNLAHDLYHQQGSSEVQIKYLYSSKDWISYRGERGPEVTNIPFPTSSVATTEGIHAIALLPPFMPWSLVAVAIGKVINTKAVHFVSKVFSSISISVSATQSIPSSILSS